MKVYAIDFFARSGDHTPTRTVQVPAVSVDEAMQKARKTMDKDETALKPNAQHRPGDVHILDIKV